MKLAIRIDAKDNVAMAMERVVQGETISVLSDRASEVDRVVVLTDVPLPFHKVALVEIHSGEPVYKYGEVIGYAVAPIGRGEWVHLHNLESANYRGQAVDGAGHIHGLASTQSTFEGSQTFLIAVGDKGDDLRTQALRPLKVSQESHLAQDADDHGILFQGLAQYVNPIVVDRPALAQIELGTTVSEEG